MCGKLISHHPNPAAAAAASAAAVAAASAAAVAVVVTFAVMRTDSYRSGQVVFKCQDCCTEQSPSTH